MSPTLIDPQKIEGWLRDIGCEPQSVTDPSAVWRFDLQFPPGVPHRISILGPTKPARAVIVITGIAFAAEHHAAFNQLDEDAKQEFIRDLNGTLDRPFVEYQLDGVTNQTLVCPIGFRVTSVIFDDGLSLDTLAFRITSVFKAEMAGV